MIMREIQALAQPRHRGQPVEEVLNGNATKALEIFQAEVNRLDPDQPAASVCRDGQINREMRVLNQHEVSDVHTQVLRRLECPLSLGL